MSKVVDILAKSQEQKSSTPDFSFEYFPPKTDAGVENLYNRFWRMSKQEPLFVDVTWGAGGRTSDLTMGLSANATKQFGLEVNMHLTCTNMVSGAVEKALEEAKANGIRNICALRGDPPEGEKKWEAVEGGFTCALDLVKHIRKNYGDYFGISVAGYPEGHPDAIKKVEDVSKLTKAEAARQINVDGEIWVCYDEDYQKELAYLKEKMDAGADVILTQLFYDADVFLAFVDSCRKIGITAPILPGIMPIGAYGGFKRMTGFCKTRVPEDVAAVIEELKDNPDGLKQQGIQIVANLAKKVWDSGKVPALHFYTLNQETATFAILKSLGVQLVDLKTEEMVARAAEVKEEVKAMMAK
mmetsp:Transcript_21901/g.43475  ORF Transcript_21901/g.43475 Transcript_21901/m.43475 type:complete len:355 (+) Transcript_21901:64-1128(+)|eukprot:CAMPEP_0175140814 /NCGR_PEP_ID=MMETSP0087-20121206/11731_1 /TAXON_ID=136419 /ORGANISM="Unknown Unknown, Strain D1" /LENGTH=354 /DNA_ID=CAMNT_0016424105 /DNA_START=53 /DNA_END=1117 /DNA_ORIENTATION=-